MNESDARRRRPAVYDPSPPLVSFKLIERPDRALSVGGGRSDAIERHPAAIVCDLETGFASMRINIIHHLSSVPASPKHLLLA
jgi:hypothetical protein